MMNDSKDNMLSEWSVKNKKLYSKENGYIDDPAVLMRVDTGQLLDVGDYEVLQFMAKWASPVNGWTMRVDRLQGHTAEEKLDHLQTLAKVNWCIHSVFQTPDLPDYIQNNHTHGLPEHYGHLDFQMLINLGPKEISRLLNTIAFRVQDGECFQPGDMIKGLYEDCDIRLDLFRETDRDVLRLIIPDKHNRFPEDPQCEAPYKNQTQRLFE